MSIQNIHPFVVSSGLCVSAQSRPSKMQLKEVKVFLDKNGFDLSFNRKSDTYTQAHRTITGIKFTSFTAADVVDYAVNHCYPGFGTDPTPSNAIPFVPKFQNILSPELTIINAKYNPASFPAGSLIVSDPPYGIDYKNYDVWVDSSKNEDWLANMSGLKGKQCVLILPWERTMLLSQEWGVLPNSMVIWVYNSNQPRQFRVVSWWGCEPNLSARGLGQKCKNPNDKRLGDRAKDGLVRLYDWWEINIVKGNSKQKNHPCPVPEELIRRIILSTASEGQHICDPFNGGGTTGVVSRRYGHPFTGFDVSSTYCHKAAVRISKVIPAVQKAAVPLITALKKAA